MTFAALTLCGCGSMTPAIPEVPREARTLEQGQLLLFPFDEPARLLGREVHLGSDGLFTIADERKAGCDVRVRSVPSRYRVTRRVSLKNSGAVAFTLPHVASLEARIGRRREAEVDVTNEAVLEADAAGSCGDVVIDRVFVGRGRRTMLGEGAAKFGLSAPVVGSSTISPSADSSLRVDDSVSWQDMQAYAFSTRTFESSSVFAIEPSVASTFEAGENVEFTVVPTHDAWFIVLGVDDQGHATVLWPSHHERAPFAKAGYGARLPGERERALGLGLVARLPIGATSSRETLVLYGFREQADFEHVRALLRETLDPAQAMSKALAELPLARWTRATSAYVIGRSK